MIMAWQHRISFVASHLWVQVLHVGLFIFVWYHHGLLVTYLLTFAKLMLILIIKLVQWFILRYYQTAYAWGSMLHFNLLSQENAIMFGLFIQTLCKFHKCFFLDTGYLYYIGWVFVQVKTFSKSEQIQWNQL